MKYAEKHKYPYITSSDGLQAVEAYKTASLGSEFLHDHESRQRSNASLQPEAQKPRVVLIDINMPILNGFEATRRIRQFEQQKNLEPATIIALTGLGSASAQQEAYSSGVDLFLTKPVRLKDLTRVLEGMPEP